MAITALMLLPGALVVYMGFHAGGYFPATPAIGALLVTQVLLVRIVQAERPFEGIARSALLAVLAMAAYALLTLASERWSHSQGRALIEFDRAWLYLVVLLLFATVPATGERLRWLIRGLALGGVAVCLAGLTSRVLPDVWHTAPGVANQRLSYPVTYWNALGLLAALTTALAFHLTANLGESPTTRALAAGALPLLCVTLFFTFSRGAIVAAILGLIVYAMLGRPRGLVSALVASVPASAALVLIAYHAKLLDTVDPTTPTAVAQGHRVALGAALCALVGGGLRLALIHRVDPQLRARGGLPWLGPALKRALAAAAILAALSAVVASGAPHRISHDWQRFISGVTPRGNQGDLRQRLTDFSDNGRTVLWRVAIDGFEASPLHGAGAGMYQVQWYKKRSRPKHVVNAHSLYLQAMAELGVPGLALLVLLIATVLIGLARRARGPRRSMYGALFAAAVVWAVAAGVDWDWEMPVVTLGFFAAAGLALSPRTGAPPGWIPSTNSRLLLGLLCLATAALPVLIIGSQRHLDDAEHALAASQCAKASSAALSSIGWLSVRAQPYEIVGLCDLERGLPHMGIGAMRQAVRLDPGSWEPHYLLALAQASAGVDPRRAAAQALALNPRDPQVREMARLFRISEPAEWVRAAAIMRAATLSKGDLAIYPS